MSKAAFFEGGLATFYPGVHTITDFRSHSGSSTSSLLQFPQFRQAARECRKNATTAHGGSSEKVGATTSIARILGGSPADGLAGSEKVGGLRHRQVPRLSPRRRSRRSEGRSPRRSRSPQLAARQDSQKFPRNLGVGRSPRRSRSPQLAAHPRQDSQKFLRNLGVP